MLTSVGVILIAVWLIIDSQQHVSSTLTLIIGIVAGLLALLDILYSTGRFRVPHS